VSDGFIRHLQKEEKHSQRNIQNATQKSTVNSTKYRKYNKDTEENVETYKIMCMIS